LAVQHRSTKYDAYGKYIKENSDNTGIFDFVANMVEEVRGTMEEEAIIMD
jgi:hypothetical protein